MASSSKKKMKGRGGSSSGKGGSPGGARVPRGSRDDSSGSDSILGSPEPHGDILGRPTVDPWYRSGERFPSVPASLQPPLPDWEWLVIREDSAADTAWTPNFREIRDLQIQRNEMLRRASDPAEIALSPEESKIEAVLADYIGRKNVALGTQAARFNSWMEHFLRIEDPLIRRAAFVSYWLSKCVFGEHPAYSIKPLYFCLAVKIAAGGDVPAVFRWVGNKFYDHSLIPSLDSEGKDYTLIAGDVASLTYLSATNAGWLPVLSSDGPQFTIYSAHRVRRQFGFDQEIPAVMGVAAGEIPTINPFLRARAFAYWSSVAARVIVPNGNRIGVYTAGMANYWRGLMAAMVEFRDSGREDISHLLESYTSPLPHPRLFGPTNTMTTYANRQSLGYAVWHHEDSRWVIYGNHHPPLWLRDHPHIAAPGKVPSSRGKRNVSAGTPIAKGQQSSKLKKREPPSKESPVRASKRKKTTAGRVGKEVLVQQVAVQDPLPAGESADQGVSAPVSKKPVRKTRAGKKTFVPPVFPSAPTSIAHASLRVNQLVSKQRADMVARIPIEIPDDLSSSSSSSDRDDPSGAAAEETESENAEAAAAEEIESEDAIINASSEEKDVEAGASTEDDEVSMDELGAAGAASDSDSTASASKPKSAEGATEEHGTVGVVTGAEKVIEITSIAITSSGGTAQGGPSGSGSHVDPPLVDSSPSTRQYVRRARRGSLVSSDSERTASASARVATPPSPPPKSGGTVPLSTITVAGVSAAATVSESGVVPTTIEETPVGEEGSAHVSDVPEEVAASEEPVQADVTPWQCYDEVLAETEDNIAGAQPLQQPTQAQPKQLNGHGLIPICRPPSDEPGLMPSSGSGNETVAEEEGRLQTAAVESAARGQPGLLSAARPATPRTSVLADMEAFFREDDFRNLSCAARRNSGFLKALWESILGLRTITEVHILEWKAVVQEAIEGGFKFGFILDYLRRLAHDMFSRRILAELRVAEARVAALREALNTVAPNPWDLASARRASAEARTESALQGLLS
uniref:Aminotransferase-like plant mobile domain-containing protein n=1 Tax=Fagus sylvatica TaxID=28930 RepID=A0A2N9G1S4_FAGSY